MAKQRSAAGASGKSRTKVAPPSAGGEAVNYDHPTATTPLRPDVGTQAQFKKRKPAKTYRYDSSLSPAMDYDGQNPARERGEALLRQVLDAATLDDAKAAARQLAAMSGPFLDWAGKAERASFDVPTLPLFVHERLSTRAIIETLTGHKRDQQLGLFSLFNDPQRPVAEQVLRAYEHQEKWANRMVLGDSLVVMNSLLGYEGLGGQVQMIYMDPPYGVKFGSNFQPFVRKRDVAHNDDADMTREPEMVQAYRDTWELGLHSYLTYLRDRLLVARELLHPSGSVFVQISDENVHHVREVMDEVFRVENFVSSITFQKTSSASGNLLGSVADSLLWYARDKERVKFRPVYLPKQAGEEGASQYTWAELPNGERRNFGTFDRLRIEAPEGSRILVHDNLTSQRPAQGEDVKEYDWKGRKYRPGKGTFKTDLRGLRRLETANRLMALGDTLRYVRFLADFPVYPIANVWSDTVTSGFAAQKLYVVQTNVLAIERCMLMTTDPGDLVLDPTCGSGTTAYVAEQWGRRWITADVSRVPLALARQRLLTATFPFYELRDEARGPAGGFVYKRRQNGRGEEVGGIVPHVTLKSIANDEPPAEEVLVDRPEEVRNVTRVTGPFAFEATIPAAADWDDAAEPAVGRPAAAESAGSFVDRMLEVLRKSPVIRLDGGRTVTLRNVRPLPPRGPFAAEAAIDHAPGTPLTPAEATQLAAERGGQVLPLTSKTVAIVIGPENGAVAERQVVEAVRAAHVRGYAHVYVFGFAISANARQTIEQSAAAFDVPATYVQATPDLLMGDLLKNMRSSQVFSVCGLPEVNVHRAADGKVQVELVGVDVFDPVKMENDGRKGNDVPAWFLDTDYNGLCFHVSQAFFPRTGAWDNLRKSLRGTYDETVWDHLAGTTSAPFEPGEHRQVAVKVIDDRGNELMVVKGI